jgi:hypothetical protein
VLTGRAQYQTSTTKTQIATWVYDPDGTLAWVRLWPTVPAGESSGVAVALDPAGNITVAGVYYTPGEDLNIVVLRFDQNGLPLHAPATWNNPAQNGADYPVDIELAQDASGLTVVGGVTTSPQTGTDYFLWALNSSGMTLATATYDGAGAPDILADIDMLPVISGAAAAAAAGDILVTGTGSFPDTKSDIMTVEFDYIDGLGLEKAWCERFTFYPPAHRGRGDLLRALQLPQRRPRALCRRLYHLAR